MVDESRRVLLPIIVQKGPVELDGDIKPQLVSQTTTHENSR